MTESKSKFWPIIGWIITIISTVSGFYFYYVSIKEREPTFITDKVTLLIDNNSIKKNPIKIIDSQGSEITENVSILTFYFFNQGRESIKRENVLKPIRILLPDSGRLLNLKILKTSRDVTESKLTYDSISKTIIIDFKILEYEDGFSAQILYVGSNPDLKIDGVIEGVNDFISTYKPPLFYKYVLGAILSTLALILLSFYKTNKKADGGYKLTLNSRKEILDFSKFAFFGTLITGLIIYGTFTFSRNLTKRAIAVPKSISIIE